MVLSKGKFYRTNNLARADLMDFAVSEYEIVKAEEIPPIPSFIDTILAHPNGKMGIMGVAGSLVLLALVLLFRPAAPKSSTKKKD